MNKPFQETVEERARRDPEFKKALEEEKETYSEEMQKELEPIDEDEQKKKFQKN